MKIFEVTTTATTTIINEGGNVKLGDFEANRIESSKRAEVIPLLDRTLTAINNHYAKFSKGTPLWPAKLLASKQFLSGSAFHFFNRAEISDLEFAKVKSTVGDIDTQVDKEQKESIGAWLTATKVGTQVGDAIYRGFKPSGEQYITLWTFPGITMQSKSGKEIPTNVQIDLELKAFAAGAPTAWSKFSQSSAWEDLQAGVKGVFHKYLIQSLAALTRKDFLLRKLVGRGKARAEQDVPTTDNMLSFAVSSKEGGGLRVKYDPVIDPKTKKPLVKDGLPVYTARPTTGYEQDLSKIFASLFDKRLNNKQLQAVEPKFWSFTGLLGVANQFLDPEEKKIIVDEFLAKTFGPAAQGLYVGDPERDANEKMVAVNIMLKTLGVKAPANFKKMVNNYKAAYKVSTDESLTEADDAPDYRRQGIKHIYNPGSTVEMKDAEFIAMCEEIAQNGGTLDGFAVNLKVDGAGIRFGRDAAGKPFMMTSRITTPLYKENIGDFAKYSQSKGQTPEQVARASSYDHALSTIVNSDFVKRLPKDTIVQAEMLFNEMAEKSKDGYKFVNISYNPKNLGKTMTLVPFAFKQFSTGKDLPKADKIKAKLIEASDADIKFVNNQLQQQGLNVSNIIAPVVNMDEKLRMALVSRAKADPLKAHAKEVLTKARKQLSDAIMNSPKVKGKDQLGKNMEGLVINLPSGRLAKVTSTEMKTKMAAKQAASVNYDKTLRTAVVAMGNFAGHRGHEQLIDYAIAKAKELHGTPFVFVGHKVGPDDPIDIETKLQTLRKLYPGVEISVVQNQVDPATGAETPGNIFKKMEYELVKKPPYYNNIVITVGSDQAGVAKVAQNMQDRFSRFAPLSHVKVSAYVTPRESAVGGTGVSTTQLRQALANPNLSEEEKLAVWSRAYNVKKLGVDWIKHLMDVARKHMNLSKIDQKITEIEGDSTSPITGRRIYDEAKRSRVRPASEKFLDKLKDLEARRRARTQPAPVPVAPVKPQGNA